MITIHSAQIANIARPPLIENLDIRRINIFSSYTLRVDGIATIRRCIIGPGDNIVGKGIPYRPRKRITRCDRMLIPVAVRTPRIIIITVEKKTGTEVLALVEPHLIFRAAVLALLLAHHQIPSPCACLVRRICRERIK